MSVTADVEGRPAQVAEHLADAYCGAHLTGPVARFTAGLLRRVATSLATDPCCPKVEAHAADLMAAAGALDARPNP